MYGCCNFYCITRLSVTGDEANYYNYGVDILKGYPQKETVNGIPVYNSQMPIIAINALSRAVQQVFDPSLKHNFQQTATDVVLGRILSIVCALFLAWLVLLWSTKLYGIKAGIFSLLLYVLCPNILAHSQMVSTDVYSFLLCTATFYNAWQYGKTGAAKHLLLIALMLGLGQISKQSLLLLYPVVFIFLWVRLYLLKMPWTKIMMAFIKHLLIIGAISLFIINAGFLFYKTGKPLNQYHFVSAKFKGLQQQFSFIGAVPLPLTEPYLAGFDYVAFNTETPPGIDGVSSYGAASFLGKPFTGKRIWYYYYICCLYKLPIPFLLFFFSGLLFYWKCRKKFSFLQDEVYLLFPAAFIFISFSLFNTMYLGIKNILLLLPLLFIFCGSLMVSFSCLDKRKAAWITGILLLWQGISTGSYFPHFLPYTNEFMADKKNAYKIFGDANLYFQEGKTMAKEYLEQHPDVQFEPAQMVQGKVMVSLETYIDYWHEGRMEWLRVLHLQPTSHFHSQYLIFTIP